MVGVPGINELDISDDLNNPDELEVDNLKCNKKNK